jgi:hypothetical protein
MRPEGKSRSVLHTPTLRDVDILEELSIRVLAQYGSSKHSIATPYTHALSYIEKNPGSKVITRASQRELSNRAKEAGIPESFLRAAVKVKPPKRVTRQDLKAITNTYMGLPNKGKNGYAQRNTIPLSTDAQLDNAAVRSEGIARRERETDLLGFNNWTKGK